MLALAEAPVTALLGARQVGKTTLARQLAEAWTAKTGEVVTRFDLELPGDRAALAANAEWLLGGASGLVIIDEIQRLPHLFEILRPLSDRRPSPARFLVLGSAAPALVKGVSESLAGRVQFIPVSGLSLAECGWERWEARWLRGGFPPSLLAPGDAVSWRWRQNFISTFLERDLPALGIRTPAETLRRFWMMLAHYHGQIWNGAELGRSLGVSEKTARHYLDLLAGAYMVRVLPPWFENISKRQVKSPKIYLRDSGIFHALLNLESAAEMRAHPKFGASWEGFAMEELLSTLEFAQPFFWATQRGAELDLLLERGGRRIGVEFKCSDAPGTTKSMHIALEELKLEHVLVVYPGTRILPIHPKITVMPLAEASRAVTQHLG